VLRSAPQHVLIPLLISVGAGILAVRQIAGPEPLAPPAVLPVAELPEHLTRLPEVAPLATPPRLEFATAEGDSLIFQSVVATGYTSSPRETDSTPFVTASMTRVRPGCLALSRDLLRTFTPGAPYDFGDWVVLPGVGIFVVEDTMNARWRNRADIWFANRREAVHWGRRNVWIARLPRPLEEGSDLFALGPTFDLQ